MQHHKPRAEDRTKALIAAQMRGESGEQDVAIVDVSTRGLLLSSAHPPRRGEIVDLTIGGHSIVGQVKWSGPRRFGIALRERISVIGLLSGDTAQITLKAREVQARRRARRATGAVPVGRAIQTIGILGAVAFAAWMLADYAGEGLGSVRAAKTAMAHASR